MVGKDRGDGGGGRQSILDSRFVAMARMSDAARYDPALSPTDHLGGSDNPSVSVASDEAVGNQAAMRELAEDALIRVVQRLMKSRDMDRLQRAVAASAIMFAIAGPDEMFWNFVHCLGHKLLTEYGSVYASVAYGAAFEVFEHASGIVPPTRAGHLESWDDLLRNNLTGELLGGAPLPNAVLVCFWLIYGPPMAAPAAKPGGVPRPGVNPGVSAVLEGIDELLNVVRQILGV